MKELNYSSKRKIFLLFIFLALIHSALGALAFEFPYAFTLPNKQIFVIHKKGISITDKDFKTVVRRERTFTGSERITTDEDYTKITHSMEHEHHIICIIKDKIFVFDINANFLSQTNELITNDIVEYYDLTIIEEYSGGWLSDPYTGFIIGYISGGKFHFLKYHSYNEKNTIELKAQFEAEDNTYIIKNHVISCKYMYFQKMLMQYHELVCAYYAEGKGIGIQKHKGIDNKNPYLEIAKTVYISFPDEIIYIKATQIDDSNILIGWITDKGVPYYAHYNIYFNEGEMPTIITYSFDNIKCQLKPQFFKFNYYTVKNSGGEALYTCLMERNIFPEHPNADIMLGHFYSFTQSGNYFYHIINLLLLVLLFLVEVFHLHLILQTLDI